MDDKLEQLPDNFPSFFYDAEIYSNPNARYVVLDFETTLGNGNPSAANPEAEIVLACWTVVENGKLTHKFVKGHEWDMDELVRDCTMADFVVAQNAKFEAGWLKRCGLDLYNTLFYDTMLAEWVLNGNQKEQLNLSSLAIKHKIGSKFDLVSALIKAGVCPSTIREDWLLEYCENDVLITHRIFRKQVPLLVKRKLLPLLHVRNMASTVLADIEMFGMDLDPVRVLSEYTTSLRRRNRLAMELMVITDGINLNSGKQVGDFLYDVLKFDELTERGQPIRTATGIRGSSNDVIKKLRVKTPEQRKFIDMYEEFNSLDSVITKNLRFFYLVVKQQAGNFKAKLQQGVTVTHRLSSAGIPTLFEGESKKKSVQFQNLPREYKPLFWAGDENYLIGECDGAQLEFRVAADVCRDPVATQEIIDGSDIHSVTAQVLTDAGEPTTRQQAKASTFAPLYGGMGKTKAQKAYAEFFKEKYRGISSTQWDWCMRVAADKQVTLPWGMIFYWPEARLDPRNGRLNVGTQVHNYPVQSFATGDIIPISLICFWHRAKGSSIQIINTIHDSIVARLKKGDEQLFEDISARALTVDVFKFLKLVYNYEFVVPLGAGIKVSRNWADTKNERTYNVFSDGSYTIKDK